MKTNVAGNVQPWASGYTAFAADSHSSSAYVMQGPFSTYGRNPDVNTTQMHNDADAAYHNAVMWYITGNSAYASKAIQLINGWSSTLTSITGSDASLAASLDGFCWVNAAEILRYSNSGWAAADITRCENWFENVWYPILDPFALYANGNWDTACVKTMMGIGIFCNDRPKFERGLQFFLNGAGNGRVTYYIVNTNGECQESGRDQAHTELGMGHLAEAAWVGWNQGLDLYAWSNNRILQGFEYTASYNLLNTVPWQNWLDRSGKYYQTAIANVDQGTKRPVFEMVWNHYQNRRGITATFTKQVADSIRPEGGLATPTDNPGFGTLLFSLPVALPPAPTTVPHSPAGLFFHGSGTSTTVNWPLVTDATSYNVKRATVSGGPYTTLATGITGTSYADTTAAAGQVYYYVVSASNAFGESQNSLELTASSGPPSPWLHQDVGTVSIAGSADYDGTFKIEASGSDIGGTADSFHFAYVPMTGDGTVTARVVWPLNSQSAKVGVMMRQTLANNSIQASTILAAAWNGTWVTRTSVGGSATVSGTTALPSPYVVNSRLMMPYWFRITRAGNTFTGSMSPDGATWTQLGSSTITMSNTIYAGLAVCSRLTTLPVTTLAGFDNVAVPAGTSNTPAAPTGLTASTVSSSQINLSWTASPGATSYNVKRATVSGGPYTTLATGVPGTTYSDTGLADSTTYFYVVSAVNSGGESANSTQGSAATTPVAPTALSATGGNLVVNLGWTQSTSPGITSNNVYRSTSGSGGPYNLLANLLVATSYSDTAASAGSTYYYSVTAINSGGESSLSAYAGAITTPAAPTGLTATAGNGQVALSWTASTGATGYSVKRATASGGPYTTIGTSTTTASYTDTTAANGTTYYYVVSAVDGAGESANSSQVSATPVAPPSAPTGLTATAASSSQINLSWTGSTGATSYNVKRSATSGGPYTTVATGVTTASYNDSSLTGGTTYYYVVSAVNTGGESANSSEANATTLTPPPSPMGLAATAASSSQINLSWTASSGATSYNVKRATVSGGPFTAIASGVATTSYSDATAASGTTYYYVVSAINSAGESANSAQASATTISAAPTGLAATPGNNQVALSWAAATGATSYNIKRATISGGPYTTIASGVSATSYTDTTTVNGTTYYYVVSAVNASGESTDSTQVSATPSAPSTPNAPTSLAASAGHKKITLTWTQSTSPNITTNNIYRATVSGGPYAKIASIAATTTYANTGLTTGTTYYYVVTAVNNSGLESPYSNQASASSN